MFMIQKEVKNIIKEISRSNGMREEHVEDMVNLPFEVLANVMRNSDRQTVTFPSVRLNGFGLFYCSEGRKEFYKKLNNKENERAN